MPSESSAVITDVPETDAPLAPAIDIVVNRDQLLLQLTAAHNIALNKTTVPMLSHILLEAREGKLFLSATNGQESLRTSLPAAIRKEGTAAVPGRKFYDYIRLLPAGDVSLVSLPNFWVQIKAGRSRTRLLGMAGKDFPALPAPQGSAIKIPAALLRSFLPRIMYAISNEESRYTLKGALLVLAPGRITMVATDGHRLAKVERASDDLGIASETKAVIPAQALAHLLAILSTAGQTEMVEYSTDESTLQFRVGTRLLSTRRLAGSFPNYQAVIPAGNTNEVLLDTAEIERSIRRVAHFADDRVQAIGFSLDANSLKIGSSSPESGQSEDLHEVPYAGKEAIRIGFNALYLLDFLKAIGGQGGFRLQLKDDNSAAVLRPETDQAQDDYLCIVMPVRVQSPRLA